MGKRIVAALGRNALGSSLPEQVAAVKRAARAVADLAAGGNEVVVTHGNGPQVEMLQKAMTELTRSDPERYIPCPLPACVAMSQGYIGYDLQNALREELLGRGIHKGVAAVLTQVEVDPQDPAFRSPDKLIGAFHTRDEAKELIQQRGYRMVEDEGRGWQRVVASPKPVSVVEAGTIRALLDSGHVVVACGGGGIPVVTTREHHLKGAAAVIDKDLASGKLAELLDADCFVILTSVEKAAVHFGKPEQRWLDTISVEEARRYCGEGHFAPGSMLPKMQAAIAFAASKPGRRALITLLEKAKEGLEGRTGTVVVDS